MTDSIRYYAAVQGTRQFAHVVLDEDDRNYKRELFVMYSDDLDVVHVERVTRELFLTSSLRPIERGMKTALVDKVRAIQRHNKEDQ